MGLLRSLGEGPALFRILRFRVCILGVKIMQPDSERTPVRRLVRPQFRVGDEVVAECDSIQNARGVVESTDAAMALLGPFPDYELITAPGVTVRVTEPNGDHEVDDRLLFHNTYVRKVPAAGRV